MAMGPVPIHGIPPPPPPPPGGMGLPPGIGPGFKSMGRGSQPPY